jgi:hypothetical protein
MAYVIGLAAFALLLWLVYLALRWALDHPWWALALVVAAVLGVPRYMDHLKQQFILGHIPIELGPPLVSYDKQESWGVGGPGDNETGVIAYDLPQLPVARLNKEGLAYLSQLPSQSSSAVRGTSYFSWAATPVANDPAWLPKRSDGNPDNSLGGPSLRAYLDQYGFGIDVDLQVEQAINRALASPGSFLAHTRGGGVLIVVPQSRKAYFIYAG